MSIKIKRKPRARKPRFETCGDLPLCAVETCGASLDFIHPNDFLLSTPAMDALDRASAKASSRLISDSQRARNGARRDVTLWTGVCEHDALWWVWGHGQPGARTLHASTMLAISSDLWGRHVRLVEASP